MLRFALISPATEVKPYYIDGAVAELRRRGYSVREMPHSRGPRHGSFAASDAERLADLRAALLDPEIDVILCNRGGYGCIHLLSQELQELAARQQKWIVGFSDISALHTLWLKAGAPSLHAAMAKQLALYDRAHQSAELNALLAADREAPDVEAQLRECTDTMLRILDAPGDAATDLCYTLSPSDGVECLVEGTAEGVTVGGNLAVLNGLAATPWDILDAEYLRGKILFLEDVGEKIYQIERMLTRLHLSGALHAVSGLIFGKFTDYRPDRNFPSMEAMLRTRLTAWGVSCPTLLNVPIGHQSHNLPIPEGRPARLTATAATATLTFPHP